MADTEVNTPIEMRKWVDLNIASGIEAGKPCSIQNIGTSDIWYSIGLQPGEENDRYRILTRGQILTVPAGSPTVWVRSDVCTGEVNVQPVDSTPLAVVIGSSAQGILCELEKLRTELALLNARFEEGFPSGINYEDVDDGRTHRG